MVAPREMQPVDLHPDDPRTLAARITVLEALVLELAGSNAPTARAVEQPELDRVGPWPDEVLRVWKERQSR